MINVCGCGSSGSTLLATALDRHPEIACGDELFVFSSALLLRDYARFRRWRRPVRWLGASSSPYHQGRSLLRHPRGYGLSRHRFWRWAAESRSLPELASRLRRHVLERTGKRHWAEKTPRNVFVIRLFLSRFAAARVIHIVRDPRDVIASLRRRGKSLLQGAEAWLASVAAIQPCRDLPNVFEVRYEDLCREPVRVLGEACAFLELAVPEGFPFSDRHASRALARFGGHASWGENPEAGFSTASVGRHAREDRDWSVLGGVRLTERYAGVLGTRAWSLAELAARYGYPIEAGPSSSVPYRAYDSRWRLDPLRRWLDRRLGAPAWVPLIEAPADLFAGGREAG